MSVTTLGLVQSLEKTADTLDEMAQRTILTMAQVDLLLEKEHDEEVHKRYVAVLQRLVTEV